MRRAVGLALAALALSACGGGSQLELDAPRTFITFDEPDRRFTQRSTSARGVVIAVRDVENDPHGPLDFWVEAIRERLRRAGGYALLEEDQVRAATGQVGHQMRFGRDEGDKPYLYWVTVFVTNERVYLVEAGGRRERFEDASDGIADAISGLRIQ